MAVFMRTKIAGEKRFAIFCTWKIILPALPFKHSPGNGSGTNIFCHTEFGNGCSRRYQQRFLAKNDYGLKSENPVFVSSNVFLFSVGLQEEPA